MEYCISVILQNLHETKLEHMKEDIQHIVLYSEMFEPVLDPVPGEGSPRQSDSWSGAAENKEFYVSNIAKHRKKFFLCTKNFFITSFHKRN